MNDSAPDTREQYSAHFPALHLLANLGWRYLTVAECLALRGSTREVLLKPRLIEVLQSRRFDYRGERFPLSPSAIDQIVRELSALSMAEGLLAANERLYNKLALGITVTEFMPDGRKHQPTIPIIDWTDPAANLLGRDRGMRAAFHAGHASPHAGFRVLRQRPAAGGDRGEAAGVRPYRQGDGHRGISQHLRNQRQDEIPQLFAYAQLLLSISQTDGRYGTTHTATKFWAGWREEEFDEKHFAIKNRTVPLDTQHALFEGKPAKLRGYIEALWSQPMLPTDQDRLLAGLLTPARLLEFLRGFVLFDRKVGKLVARYQQFFGIRALLNRIDEAPGRRARRRRLWHTTGSGKSFTMVFLTKALLLHQALQECRVVVVTDRIDLETQLARNFITGGAFGSAIATRKEGEGAR